MIPLTCRPVAEEIQINGDLRKILLKKLWPKDDFSKPQYIDRSWEPYIQGLIDANIKGAEELRDLVVKYDRLMFDLQQDA